MTTIKEIFKVDVEGTQILNQKEVLLERLEVGQKIYVQSNDDFANIYSFEKISNEQYEIIPMWLQGDIYTTQEFEKDICRVCTVNYNEEIHNLYSEVSYANVVVQKDTTLTVENVINFSLEDMHLSSENTSELSANNYKYEYFTIE